MKTPPKRLFAVVECSTGTVVSIADKRSEARQFCKFAKEHNYNDLSVVRYELDSVPRAMANEIQFSKEFVK